MYLVWPNMSDVVSDYSNASSNSNKYWLLDSKASHNITVDLSNLHSLRMRWHGWSLQQWWQMFANHPCWPNDPNELHNIFPPNWHWLVTLTSMLCGDPIPICGPCRHGVYSLDATTPFICHGFLSFWHKNKCHLITPIVRTPFYRCVSYLIQSFSLRIVLVKNNLNS